MRLERIYRHASTPWAIQPNALHALFATAKPASALVNFVEDEKDEDEVKDGVAVIDCSGIVDKDTNALDRMAGALDVDDLQAKVARAIDDPAVSSIVLDFDSPGGVVTGVPEVAAFIAEAGKVKPIVAFTDSLMCSAAYWLASGSGAIVASPSSEVGSIGVYLPVMDVSAYFEKQGVKVDVIKAGTLKAIGYPGTGLSDEQRSHLQTGVDEVHSMFKDAVTQHRQVPQDAMEGQSLMGSKAIHFGLVDELGSLADAVDLARSLAAVVPKSDYR